MKIKDGYILKKVMGSYMVVALEGEFNAMQTVNETGAFIWAMLEGGSSLDEICESIVSEYDVDPLVARSDIESFVAKLREASLLDE